MSFEKETTMRAISEDLKIERVCFPNKRIIVLGDVHGCYDEMIKLLEDVIDYSPRDILISVGDLIMKGPKSSKVLKYFMADRKRLAVKGNHEYAVQRWYEHIHFAPEGTPVPYGLKEGSEHQRFAESMSEKEYEYICDMPHILKVGGDHGRSSCCSTSPIPFGDLVILHAGINPNVALEEQNSFDVMHVRNVYQGRCTELISVGDHWVKLIPSSTDTTYVYGHDATRRLQEGENYCGLDTACLYGIKLSAAVFHEGTRTIYSVDALQAYCGINTEAIL